MNTLSQLNRICKICQKDLPYTEFGVCTRYSHGTPNYQFYKSYCKPCEVYRVRRAKLHRMYGLTEDQYNLMLVAQDWKCLLCSKQLIDKGKREEQPCIDHDHVTGQVRGLLCWCCNAGLGMFKENPEVLLRAIQHIKPIEVVID